MNLDWQPIGGAPAGGAILQIEGDPGEVAWAASPAGLFRKDKGSWSNVRRGMPLAQVGAVLARRRYVLAAGLQGGAYYSLDGGSSWQPSRIEQSAAALGCLAASPNFWQDGVLLAGTQGDGVLRSSDSGRSWALANFGLHNFTIFSLAAAPVWGRKELVFAGTAGGVYLSPNGGRAWKPCGLDRQVILSLAVSPDFDRDQTLLVGAEEGLYRSQDGGATWALVDLGLSSPPTVNALWFSQNGRAWLGASEYGVWLSSDGGESWITLENSPIAVLSLGGSAERVYAGTFDQGLYNSTDDGASWHLENTLVARRFQWLASVPEPLPASPIAASPAFLAGGPLEGLWLATEGGRAWQPLLRLEDDEPPLCMAVDASGLWVGGSDGVWKAAFLEEPFTRSLQAGEAITALVCTDGKVWAGGVAGSLWVTYDGGRRWQRVAFPGKGAALLALAAAGQQLLAVVRDAPRRQVQIWRGYDSSGLAESIQWELWLEQTTSWEAVQIVHGGPGVDQWAVVLGTTIYCAAPDGMRRVELPEARTPPHGFSWSPGAQMWLAAAGDILWASHDLTSWQPVETNLPVAEVVAFQSGSASLAALTVDGRLWQWRQL